MLIADFKGLVADYLNRDSAVFDMGVDGKVDKVLQAANNAKAYAQRLVKFEAAKIYAKLMVSQTDGGAIKDLTDLNGNPIRVRNFEHALLKTQAGAYFPIDLVGRDVQLNAIQQSYPYEFNQRDPVKMYMRPQAVLDAGVIRLEPWPHDLVEPQEMHFRVTQWMPEYSEDVTEDFFLVECRDWMLYRSILELNFFLKEDQRVVLSAQIVKDAWDAVKSWNAEFMGTTADLSLD